MKNKQKTGKSGKAKYQIPENFLYKESRNLFVNPDVSKGDEVEEYKWGTPDEEGLKTFLIEGKGFSEVTVK